MSLVLQDVSIQLGARVLVPALNATVPAGAVLALMGPSGCGKSTLLAWLAGLPVAPLEGRGAVRVDGLDVSIWPTERRRIGLLFQDDLLFPHLSVRDNLLFALPAGARTARVQTAERALDDAGLNGFAERMPGSLSGGQRARVSLLRALLAAPAALLLDEPFGTLDTSLREQMRQFTFAMLARRRVPALLVTHDAADIPAGARTVALDHDA